ncbi:MAG: oligopeptide transporter, OPT family [Bacteroidales bacterium]|nr:oligopeptide transporter, OPT family [Bacteroidales bacterium]
MAEQKKFVPFVSAETNMTEFTIRALIIGLILAVVLGAANAYLGLKAGMTIAATYPAAVIGMALIKIMKGSILEENFARTVGSIGESVAAGAIFTIPAFYIVYLSNKESGIEVENFFTYGTTTMILIAGGVLGIMFVALLRKVMVDDADLPFPESVAAAEIHKTGRTGGGGSKLLFGAMIFGAIVKTLSEFKFFAGYWEKFIIFTKQTITGTAFTGQGGIMLASPGISPAYMGVGYIIGPRLASLNFSGSLLAWGLLTPMILYFIAPGIDIQAIAAGFISENPLLSNAAAEDKAWIQSAYDVWKYIVRPIAIGGMLVGAIYTLWMMRKSLFDGISRSVGDVKKAAKGHEVNIPRNEKDMSFTWIIAGIVLVAIATFLITKYIFHTDLLVAFVAATVMIILAFFFAAVSGYLVGLMGSSNNPISGLTLTALVITALIMVLLGVSGHTGVAATLGVAAIVCVSAAVAGEMLQDLKAGHILGGTPWRMQVGDIIGVVAAGAVMFFILDFLNQGDIANGIREGYEGGFGSKKLSAPQASLMAILSDGIVGGRMAWPLIITGMLMGLAFILMQVKSPMLVCVGMYLPLETTFAIFVGGLVKGIVQSYKKKRKLNNAQGTRVENTGILLASGLIAGEALAGLVFAIFAVGEIFPSAIFIKPSYLLGLLFLIMIALVLIRLPLNNAGSADEPAPPSAGH